MVLGVGGMVVTVGNEGVPLLGLGLEIDAGAYEGFSWTIIL